MMFGWCVIVWVFVIVLGVCVGVCVGVVTRMEGLDARARARGDARDESYVGGSLLVNVL